MAATNRDVRAARQYLRRTTKAGTKDINPRKYAAAAKELGVGFRSLLKLIRYMYASGDERAEMRRNQILKPE